MGGVTASVPVAVLFTDLSSYSVQLQWELLPPSSNVATQRKPGACIAVQSFRRNGHLVG